VFFFTYAHHAEHATPTDYRLCHDTGCVACARTAPHLLVNLASARFFSSFLFHKKQKKKKKKNFLKKKKIFIKTKQK